MLNPQRPARTEILTRVLDAYERSSSYASDGAWRRDIILKLDHATFPDSFAPDGRERRAELLHAASDLEQHQAVRIARHSRGPLAGEPKELRLGPVEVSQAYALAAAFGYEPLATGLSRVERRARSLASEAESQPARSFLEGFANRLPSGDLSPVGMGRSKFKQEWRALMPALTAAMALLRGVPPAWERVISERLFCDSKLLGRVRHHVINLLLRIDPKWDGIPQEDASDLLEAYGVRRKPGLLRCAGAAAIRVNGRDYMLEDFTPTAHLPDAWSDAWVEALAGSGVQLITTIENEYPFLSYVEEAGGPRNLGARGEVAVYTAGFPTPALVAALVALSERVPGLEIRHWGDADVGGLRIWWFLRCRLDRPVSLFRTTAAWVESEIPRGGKPLTAPEVEALQRLKSQVSPVAGEDTRCASELIDKLVEHGIRIEQERF
jgi:hypothetical protein